MSSNKESNDLDAYASALACFEQTESLFHNNTNKHYSVFLEHLKNCLFKVDYLISLERDDDNQFLIPLLQLKQEMLSKIQKIQNNIKSDVKFWNHDITISKISIPPNKRQPERSMENKPAEKRNRVDDQGNSVSKKILNTMKNIEETPLVCGFQDIAGLCEVKRVLRSSVILPQKQPQLFENGQLCNTILLYGPPGTGKTRIVHALAAEGSAKLYSISVGNILSSYVGQTEETIQGIFKYIKNSGNYSILFIDEVDGLCRKRTGNEHEYTRRIKTEFMCQLSQIQDCSHMYVICATNCPWDLDTAILRRFLRCIYIPLPVHSERLEFFRMTMRNTTFEKNHDMLSTILDRTEGYSGADLSTIVKHALNIPIIELQDTKVWKCLDGYYEPISKVEDIGKIICCDLNELPPNSVRARNLNISDLLSALDNVTATVSKEDVIKFEKFSINNRD